MNASNEEQLRLLELQRVDTLIDQIDHSVDQMPERAELAESDRRAGALAHDVATVGAEASDLAAEVNRIETAVETARRRMARDHELLESGRITAGRQLGEIQHEVTSLERRIAELEDEQLDVMERAEATAQTLARLQDEADSAAQRSAHLRRVIESKEQALGADRAAAAAERGALAADLPAGLLALYERIRAHQGGVGAAVLAHGRCGGCHLQLSPTEHARILSATPDEVVRCDECRRILVRKDQ